jgi:probable F420-dependent oxidoreductase
MEIGARTMKVRFAVGPDGASLPYGDVAAFADVLEAGGFDGVWLSDIPLGPELDPLIGLALIAGRTRRLKLGANVVPLGRNPFLLAKGLAQLDQLSDGRVLLSFVPGIDEPGEREALGLSGVGRGAALEEVVGLVRSWWAGEAVEHHSSRWSFTALAAPVCPLQAPLEAWLGGRGPKALERVGRIADGWLGAQLTPEEARVACRRIEDSAERAGRQFDPEHFGMSIAYARTIPEPAVLRAGRARRTDIDPLEFVPVGEHGLRSLLVRYIDAGLSKFVLRPVGSVTSWDSEVEWLAGAVLDLQT